MVGARRRARFVGEHVGRVRVADDAPAQLVAREVRRDVEQERARLRDRLAACLRQQAQAGFLREILGLLRIAAQASQVCDELAEARRVQLGDRVAGGIGRARGGRAHQMLRR